MVEMDFDLRSRMAASCMSLETLNWNLWRGRAEENALQEEMWDDVVERIGVAE